MTHQEERERIAKIQQLWDELKALGVNETVKITPQYRHLVKAIKAATDEFKRASGEEIAPIVPMRPRDTTNRKE